MACVRVRVYIKISNNLKPLGETIDNRLNFSDHIRTVCTVASKKVDVVTKFSSVT